jgi:hypothetical protein
VFAPARETQSLQRLLIRGPGVYATQWSFNGPIGTRGHEVKCWWRFNAVGWTSLPGGRSYEASKASHARPGTRVMYCDDSPL